MKNIIAAIICTAVLAGCASQRKATATFETLPDPQSKILYGTINRQIIENDTSFAWFAENMKYGTADEAAVAAFRNNANNFSMVVFGGTWCEDTHNLLPVFYRLVDKSGYPDKKITLVGVDREKKAPNDLHLKYNVTNVPTFIVFRDGKEVGRVVEYGQSGQIDKELGEIVVSSAGQ